MKSDADKIREWLTKDCGDFLHHTEMSCSDDIPDPTRIMGVLISIATALLEACEHTSKLKYGYAAIDHACTRALSSCADLVEGEK